MYEHAHVEEPTTKKTRLLSAEKSGVLTATTKTNVLRKSYLDQRKKMGQLITPPPSARKNKNAKKKGGGGRKKKKKKKKKERKKERNTERFFAQKGRTVNKRAVYELTGYQRTPT